MKITIELGGRTSRPHRRLRRIVVAALLFAAVGAPLAFAAVRSDVFSDVPSTAADHDAINRVYNAGIMSPCATSPSLQFCPNNNVLRRGVAKQYDYTFGLSGTPGNFTPTFRGANLKGAPLTTDSTALVQNLNADQVDGMDASQLKTPIYHASVYSSGAKSNAGNSPELVSSSRIGTGLYDVKFSVGVSACGRVATLGIPSDQQNSSDTFKGFKGEISTFYDLKNGAVAVATFNSAGTAADQDFQLVVVC